jgi:hypothetical protein
MTYLCYFFFGILAGGPFALLWYQRLAHTYDRDPLNWEYGNHGPWWGEWEQSYLFLNGVVFFGVCLGQIVATLRVWRSDCQITSPVRHGCGMFLLLMLILLAQLPINFSMY